MEGGGERESNRDGEFGSSCKGSKFRTYLLSGSLSLASMFHQDRIRRGKQGDKKHINIEHSISV